MGLLFCVVFCMQHTTSTLLVPTMKRSIALAGVGIGAGLCALVASGGLAMIRRRLFGASQQEACRPVVCT